MDQLSELPKNYVFLNYLRCHDDIGWGLDYEWLKQFGISEVPHKRYLNDYFTGNGRAVIPGVSYTMTILVSETPDFAVLPQLVRD